MDKIKTLKCISNSQFFPHLTKGELKLYILLLVNAKGSNNAGTVGLNQLKAINNRMPSLKELEGLLASLERYGFVVIKGIKGWPDGNIEYRLKLPGRNRKDGRYDGRGDMS